MKRRNRQEGKPGYYPGYDTLGQQKNWDDATRETVLNRVNRSQELHFFSPKEAPLIEAIFEHIVPQSDRTEEYRIPIVPAVDERLSENQIDGYRYEKMPPDQEAYLLGMQAIEEMAWAAHNRGFLDLTSLEQDELLRTLHDAEPRGAEHIWERMPAERFWMLLVQDAAAAYYAHPYAWDEIGFGGPAYPRPYMRLERGEPEPWEVEEERYEWEAPADSVSDIYEPVAKGKLHRATPGQGGTH
jgi:hypothetical protein